MSIRIIQGDCVAVMATLPECSVDAIVTDPPYHLTQASRGGHARTNNPASPHARHRIGDKGFMGQVWDGGDVAFRTETWAAALRVLKPGGHLLAFSGTRTYHRMACGVEEAGFEIRDQIGWVFSSGFPKSHNLDKLKGSAICGCESSPQHEVSAVFQADLSAPEHDGRECQNAVQQGVSEQALPDPGRPELPGAEVRPGQPGMEGWCNAASQEGQLHPGALRAGAGMGASDGQEGWLRDGGKPLAGTVAQNVLAHGTGALNIDGCRVPAEKATGWGGGGSALYEGGLSREGGAARPVDSGRWPANLIHDGSDEVLAAFPQAPGAKADVAGDEPSDKTTDIFNTFSARTPAPARADGGGSAARFFYTAKTSRAERNEGLEDTGPQFRSGRTPRDAERVEAQKRGNHHPTVKPVDLMRYLCRLITPPGGIVLDPFCGSGSTLKAAELEGFSAIGIELDPAYVEIARRRIAADAPLFADVQVEQ